MPYPIKYIGYLIDICWLVFLFYWLANAFGNKKSIYKTRHPFARILAMFLAVVAASVLARYKGIMPIMPYNKLTQIIGVALCAFGVGYAIWARRILGRNWSANATVKENHELIQTGPYKITRHPIYTGMIIAFLGTLLAVLPNWAGLAFFVFGIVGLYLKMRKEEQLMTQTFPNEYGVYRERVRYRLIPYIF